jgi:hypothetical protein
MSNHINHQSNILYKYKLFYKNNKDPKFISLRVCILEILYNEIKLHQFKNGIEYEAAGFKENRYADYILLHHHFLLTKYF